MRNKRLFLLNIVILFVVVGTVLFGRSTWTNNYETVEATKVADEQIENELTDKEKKEREDKRDRIYKKLRGDISEIKLDKQDMKNKEDFDGFRQPTYNIYGQEEQAWEAPTTEVPETYQTNYQEQTETFNQTEENISNVEGNDEVYDY